MKSDAHARCMSDSKAFFDAIRAGDAGKVREMLASDHSLVNAKTERGFSPVTVAAYYRQADILDVILSHRPTMTVHDAALSGDLKHVRELVGKNPKLANDVSSPDGFPPLALAAYAGRAEVVKILVKAGANVNYLYESGEAAVLVTAAANGNPEIVKTLLDAGADPNIRTKAGKTPLAMAVEKGKPEIAEMLRQRGGTM